MFCCHTVMCSFNSMIDSVGLYHLLCFLMVALAHAPTKGCLLHHSLIPLAPYVHTYFSPVSGSGWGYLARVSLHCLALSFTALPLGLRSVCCLLRTLLGIVRPVGFCWACGLA